jgi:hypothetical protein
MLNCVAKQAPITSKKNFVDPKTHLGFESSGVFKNISLFFQGYKGAIPAFPVPCRWIVESTKLELLIRKKSLDAEDL